MKTRPEDHSAHGSKMSTIRLICGTILLALICGPRVSGADAIQPHDMFEAAIRDYLSTGSDVLLVTVVDDRTRQARTVCTTAKSLLDGIVRETGASLDKAIDAALA